MDGTTTLRMNEFMLATTANGKYSLDPSKNTSTLPAVEELVFELDDKVQKAIKESEARFDELVGKHHLEVYHSILNRPIFLLGIFQSPKQKKGITLPRVRQEFCNEKQNISRRNCSTDQTTRIP
jgi:hypothetical protein